MNRSILPLTVLAALTSPTLGAPTVIYDNFRTNKEGDLRWGRGSTEVGLFGPEIIDEVLPPDDLVFIPDLAPVFPVDKPSFPGDLVHSEYKANAVRIGAKESAVIDAATLAVRTQRDSGNWQVVIYADRNGIPGNEIARSAPVPSRPPRRDKPVEPGPLDITAHIDPVLEDLPEVPPKEGGRRSPLQTFEFEDGVFLSGGDAYWFALVSDETGTPGQTARWLDQGRRPRGLPGDEIVVHDGDLAIFDGFPPVVRDRTRTGETATFDSRDVPPPPVMDSLQKKLRRTNRHLGDLTGSLEIARELDGGELDEFLDSIGYGSVEHLNEDIFATRNHVRHLRQVVRSPGWQNTRDGSHPKDDIVFEIDDRPPFEERDPFSALIPGSLRLEGTLTQINNDGEDGPELNAASTTEDTTATIKNIDAPVDPGSIEFHITEIDGSTDGGFSVGLVASDVIEIEGLDGITFVLEIGYDENLIADESDALVYWFDELDGTWKNAVLGNDYGAGFNPGLTLGSVLGAYDPATHTLGHYGVDTANNIAWAVINHNSSFIVTPEPSRALIGLAGLAAVAFRRRRRA